MQATQEKRIRDFIEIVDKCLKAYRLSLRQYDTARRCLERMKKGTQRCSPENLYTVGSGLLNLVAVTTAKRGRKETIQSFWHDLLGKLRQSFPSASTSDQWAELLDVGNLPEVGEPRWKEFLVRWTQLPVSIALSPEVAAALKPYREDMAEKFNEISLSGFGGPVTLSEAEGKAELSNVYIDLDTKAEPAPDGRTSSGGLEQGQSSFSAVPALQRLADNRRLVMIGLPGSGKSTLLKFFGLSLVRHGLNPDIKWSDNLKMWPQEDTDLIPVFVELRKFAGSISKPIPDASGAHLTDYICTQLKLNELGECEDALKKALVAGRAIVLLDGLDEVPDNDQLRRFVLDTVDAFARGPFKASRIVVTCRPRSYDDPAWRLREFKLAELKAFDLPKIKNFIALFYKEIARHDRQVEEVKLERMANLEKALQRQELQDLATNPLMLTVMAWLHRSMQLPKKRALILNQLVDQLLFKWEEHKLRDDKEKMHAGEIQTLTELLKQHDLDVTSLRRVLCRLAFRSHQQSEPRLIGQRSDFALSIPKTDLLSELAELPPKNKITKPNRENWALLVIHVIEQRTGLLVPEGVVSFIMPYKLQEYLAGEHLTDGDELEAVAQATRPPARQHEFGSVLARLVGENGYWEEVVKWAAAIQAHDKKNRVEVRELASQLCEIRAPSKATALRRAIVAQEILWEVGVNEVALAPRGPECLECVRKTLEKFMFRKSLTPKQRAAAGASRGHLEDLPSGVDLTNDGSERIPDIAWVKIPSGKFLMGDEDSWPRGEKPEIKTEIETPYSISRYPVTVAQFRAFVEDGGYQKESFWDWSKEAANFFKGIEKMSNEERQKPGPVDYDPVFQTPSHPRVGVSWFEAVAFCQWLNKKPQYARNIIRLPSEKEWERAVRGTDGRAWPWGESNADLLKNANFFQSSIAHTSAVGLFPSGDTPPENGNKLGLADLAGNVWEWCLTKWMDKYPENYDGLAGDNLNGNSYRVARGGSYSLGNGPNNFDIMEFFSRMRRGFIPGLRERDLGFRLVCVGESNK